jgi:drug/metabolite transporter (DMT)-like permease
LAIQDYSPSTFLFYRFLAATLVLSLIFVRYLKKTYWHSVKIGVGLAIPLLFNTYLQTLGIKHTSASQCTFVAGICVVIIPVLKLIFYRTAVPLKVWIAALVALNGLFIITVKDDLTMGIGDLYTLTGAIGFAFYLLQVEKHSKRENLIYTIVPMFGIFGAIAAFYILGEVLTWRILKGGSVIFIATMISELNFSRSLSRIKRQYGIS